MNAFVAISHAFKSFERLPPSAFPCYQGFVFLQLPDERSSEMWGDVCNDPANSTQRQGLRPSRETTH